MSDVLETENTKKIAALNDRLRCAMNGGRILLTPGVAALDPEISLKVLHALRAFDAFAPDNDPYEEHDFGSFEVDRQWFIWKIDYYAPDLMHGSEDPADENKTVRVLTLMLAHEY